LSLSSARSHPAASSSIHEIFLLVDAIGSPATAAASPAAAGHSELAAIETAAEPSLNDLAQIAGHERDHLDAVSGDHRMQRPGYRAAYQCADAEFRQTNHLLKRQVVRQDFLRFSCNSPRLGRDDMDLPGDVEDRRYPMVPVGEGRFHDPSSCIWFTWRILAIVVPRSAGAGALAYAVVLKWIRAISKELATGY
jgi:hypothetical protein